MVRGMLDVLVVPNQRRPGAGLEPKSEPRRAWLPQQSRYCPVVEDANRLGVLVYPPLALDEVFQVRLVEGGVYRFSFLRQERLCFTLLWRGAAGAGASTTLELLQHDASTGVREAMIPDIIDTLAVNIGGLPGGIGLRGAHDFVTPDGWDTIYTGVLNKLERPSVPSLTVRVETDWFRQPTEFRYQLEVGDGISAAGYAPVGQVFFVPREPLTLRAASDAERVTFRRELESYWGRKPEQRRYSAYGGIFDWQYRGESRAYEQAHGPLRSPFEPSTEARERPPGEPSG
jgi:hypothetical protein